MISIIIPTYNRSASLESTLQFLLKSNLEKEKFEILVVDNGSTDNTKDVTLKTLSPTSFKFKYLFEPEPGLLSGRHKGAQEASGNILTFIDDDVEVSSGWLKGIYDVFAQNENISFVTGPCLPKYEVYPPDWVNYFWAETPYGGKECSWLSLIDLGNKPVEIHPNWVWGLNFSIRKSVFDELQGFNPDNIKKELQHFQGNGETGLTLKAEEKGLKALYHPEVLLYHQVPRERLSIAYFKKRAFYAGVSVSFTDLREGKPKAAAETAQNNSVASEKNIKSKLRHLYGVLFNKQTAKPLNTEIQQLLAEVRAEGKKGYDFHQQAFYSNEKVKNWVLQKDFMNYKLPL
ncbi:MAG TPA: glycosyltransferase family 2 protein [Bacteroidia bacterium]|jgi:glycosyltransferase involved in cell wall biosynthesis|nr:glycosyltransferase family 2 protein [Bacteroidia bacterium]